VSAELRAFLGLPASVPAPPFDVLQTERGDGHERHRIEFTASDGDRVPAYLLVPTGPGPFPAVLALHQHNSQWHLGKSEVCGLAGDPLNAFGPALAARGFVVLAPDSVSFEDRRMHTRGLEPHDKDWLHYFHGMAYRLVDGKLLMTKALGDAMSGVSLLLAHPQVAASHVGVLGHSYGGNHSIFLGAVDDRLAFVCTSGAACSYTYKMAHATGLEMSLVIPGFHRLWDMADLIALAAPKPYLVVSASEDVYSADADVICAAVAPRFDGHLDHARYPGGHALTRERFDRIVAWVAAQRAY
jgi:dienelactone hydrolase